MLYHVVPVTWLFPVHGYYHIRWRTVYGFPVVMILPYLQDCLKLLVPTSPFFPRLNCATSTHYKPR